MAEKNTCHSKLDKIEFELQIESSLLKPFLPFVHISKGEFLEADILIEALSNQAKEHLNLLLSGSGVVNSEGHDFVSSDNLKVADIIASLLLLTPEERQNNPDSLKEGLGKLFNGFQDVLQGSISDDPEQIETARKRMQAFRRYLENQGITVSDDFESLPEKLRQRCQTATTDPELKERAQDFVKSTEEVKQSFTNLLQTLKSGAEKLRETLEEVSGRE